MAQLLRNNLTVVLGATLPAGGSTMTLDVGLGAKLPVVTSPDFLLLTLWDKFGNIEIVRVTDHASAADTMTVVKGQEGTDDRTWEAGTPMQMRITAGTLAPLSVFAGANDAAGMRAAIGAGQVQAIVSGTGGAVVDSTDPTQPVINIPKLLYGSNYPDNSGGMDDASYFHLDDDLVRLYVKQAGVWVYTGVSWPDEDWIPADATKAEAEAGTETGLRMFSPQRIAQAIAALGGGGGWKKTVDDEALYEDGGVLVQPPIVENSVDNWTPARAFSVVQSFESDAYAYRYSVETGFVQLINRSDKNSDSGPSGEVGYLRAFKIEVVHDAHSFLNDAYALSSIVRTTPSSTGNIQFSYGGHSAIFHEGEGELANAYSHFSEIWVPGSGKIDIGSSYYGDLHKGPNATVNKHVTVRNKDLTSHVTDQYGIVLYGNSRVGNGNVFPTHALEVAGELDLQPDNNKSLPASLKFSDKEAMFYDAGTLILGLNLAGDFSAVDTRWFRSTKLTIWGDYGGYDFPNYAPSAKDQLQVSDGGDGSSMIWSTLSDLLSRNKVSAAALSDYSESVSVTATSEIELAKVAFTAKADTAYLIIASANFIKDTGTLARFETVRVRQGTDNTGPVLAMGIASSAPVASTPFGSGAVHAVVTPGAGSVTFRLSAKSAATSTITCSQARIDVIALSVLPA